ncbi:MAG: rimJ [Sedimentibacter sp.]|nr:rimJ [Sedimentibacter sp.]
MFKQTRYETERLYLKILKPVYGREVLEYYKRNHNFLSEWEPKRTRDFYTLSYHKRQLNYEYNTFKNNSLVRFWIVKNFMGYKLDKDEINKGYMTEAIEKTVQIMFDDFNLHRIEVNVVPRNQRSLKVMEKLKFEQEGFSKRYLEINGVWEDHIHFAVYNDK